MSLIFGWLAFDDAAIEDRQVPEKMVRACSLWPHDRVGIAADATWLLGCKQLYNTPQSPLAAQPVSSSDDRYRLVFDGRIDNREQIARSLDLTLSDETTDEELILGAYAQCGDDLGKHLIGDFAIAIVDTLANSLFLIRDHMGVRPLFLGQSEQGIAFASTKAALLTLPWIDRTPNDYWIADLLASRKVDVDKTIYQGIETLPPAHRMKCSAEERVRQRYWQLHIRSDEQKRSSVEYVEDFKTLLKEAVRCRLRCYSTAASEMSGGLDSTTVTAIASNIMLEDGQKMQAFSHVMPRSNIGRVFPFKDESDYIAAVCQKHPNISHHPITGASRGVLSQLKRNVELHSGPSRRDLTLMGEELLINLRESGIRTLLSGFGGDQMVTSHGHGWENEYIQRRDWAGLRRELKHQNVDVRRKLFRYLKYRIPAIGKLVRKFQTERWNLGAILEIMSPALARATGYPARANAHPTRRRIGTVREQEHDVLHSPHVVYRLEDCAVGASAYGVDYRYPLLDIRLMQYYLDLPSDQKIGLGVQRKMIRNATAGILPDKIRTRYDKSRATIPTVLPRFLRDREVLRTTLNDLKRTTRLEDYAATDGITRFLDHITPDRNPKRDIKLSSVVNVLQLGLWLKNK